MSASEEKQRFSVAPVFKNIQSSSPPPCWWKVGWSFVVRKTFSGASQQKTASQCSPKQPKQQPENCKNNSTYSLFGVIQVCQRPKWFAKMLFKPFFFLKSQSCRKCAPTSEVGVSNVLGDLGALGDLDHLVQENTARLFFAVKLQKCFVNDET